MAAAKLTLDLMDSNKLEVRSSNAEPDPTF
jgi:hypothetical protein